MINILLTNLYNLYHNFWKYLELSQLQQNYIFNHRPIYGPKQFCVYIIMLSCLLE